MQAAEIVEALNVSEQLPSCLGPCGIEAMMDPLGFQGVEEALHGCIVPAIALAAHGWGDARGGKRPAVGAARD